MFRVALTIGICQAILAVLSFSCTKIDYTMPRSKTQTKGKVDTTFVKSILQGTHPLTYTDFTRAVSNPAVTARFLDQVQISIVGNTYTVPNPPQLPLYMPGGQGTFSFVSDTSSKINFINVREFPTVKDPGVILNGVWSFTVYDSYILLSKENFYTTPQNISYQTFSTFKITRICFLLFNAYPFS
jgi:hypothetical protein